MTARAEATPMGSDGDANATQMEQWNAEEGNHWVEHEATHDAMLDPFGLEVLAAAGLEDGDRVVDVGCGTGGTTLVAAAHVAPSGSALGIDISVPMITRAVARAVEERVANVRFEVGDAQTAALGDAVHDAAISRFGIMFFADPVAAFTNIAASLRPGARLAFACWQALEDNEWIFVPGLAAAAHVPLPDIGEPGTPGPFAFADPDRARSTLLAAGFRDIEVTGSQQRLLLGGGASLDDTVTYLRGTGMARALFRDAPPDAEALALGAVRDALEPYATADGVYLGGAAWIIRATC